MEKIKFLSKANISKLPKNPGVYIFKKGGEFLYIGKANNLKERVKNHFQQPLYRDHLFINRVSKIGYIKTASEIEALILEANLIKKYQPKYNVVWRDDKNYFYVGVTKENYPRVFITHQPSQKLKIDYVGPFVEGNALKQTLKILRKVFPYRTCKTLPGRSCLWYQLRRCPAPCLIKKQTYGGRTAIILKNRMKSECQRNAKNLLKILQGKKNQVLKNLKKKMKQASNSRNFEEAAKIRDQIKALEKVLAHAHLPTPETVSFSRETKILNWAQIQKKLQKILNLPAGRKREISRIEAYDVSCLQGQEATGSMVTFVAGLPDKNFYRKFKIKISGKPNDIAMLKEILSRRFKHLEWPFPDLILIDGGRGQLNAALAILKKQRKSAKISVMALAKKRNELFAEGRKGAKGKWCPISLKNLPREIFNLILQLRDEAHRFAISYHKKLRDMALLKN